MVSIHRPLSYEPNTLTTAPLRYTKSKYEGFGEETSLNEMVDKQIPEVFQLRPKYEKNE